MTTRIGISRTTPVGKPFGQVVNGLIAASQLINRVKSICDAIAGADMSLLEASIEAEVASGQGAAFYADVQSLKAAIDSTLSTLAKYDMGQ